MSLGYKANFYSYVHRGCSNLPRAFTVCGANTAARNISEDTTRIKIGVALQNRAHWARPVTFPYIITSGRRLGEVKNFLQ